MTMFKLSQTLAGTWVITLPNPFEEGWETQLADFNTQAVTPGTPVADAMDSAIVATLVGFLRVAPERGYKVTSHDDAARDRMAAMVEEAMAPA